MNMLKLLIFFFKSIKVILQMGSDLCYGISQLLEYWVYYKQDK